MFELAWWWMVVVLPVPLLVYRYLPRRSWRGTAALQVPAALATRWQHNNKTVTISWRRACLLLAWCALVLAAMRPQWVGEATAVPQSGRDLMVVLDLSESMLQRDFVFSGELLSRLGGTLRLADEFIARRTGDRIGLILFADHAYVQTPLTFDTETVRHFLGEAQVGLAGKRTAIGEALGLAVKKMTDGNSSTKNSSTDQVILLFTDGENTAGVIEPLTAAELARDANIKVYTISIGPEFIQTDPFFFSQRVSRSDYADEKTLQAIADMTKGQHFFAGNADELQSVYQAIDALEPVESDVSYYRPRKEYYLWPLTVTFLCMLLFSCAVALGRD